MKKLAILSLAAILAVGCQAQEGTSKDFALTETQRDSVKPKGQWSVHKEVDEHGNVVRYDSIYSWSSSGNDVRALQRINPDSLMAQMRNRMRSSFGMMDGDPFQEFFGNDSTHIDPFKRDPFINDFFNGNGVPTMDALRERMEKMMQQGGFSGFHRPLIPAVPEEKRKKNLERTQQTI